MAKSPETGSAAPDFTLQGVLLDDSGATRHEYRLAEAKGSPLVLVFYPGDNTPVCTKQLCSYTSELSRFKDLGATVWAVSPQGLESHEAFARQYDLRFPLLADPEREVARSYGIAVPGLGLRRSVFILDAEGTVRWRHIALAGLTFQHTDTLTAQLAAL
ncbi:peroxiredoxin family protein [Kitasatospora viridis]|uniref:thioredoxin-dependent peroxiredoxin n=1 Tax=Kitasatospora viridis TaxID=281105 RepID=A0A561UMQ9_9ACTN|nr:peroxiredoxin family protein [Kitasatospora viridis]TWG00653.1 peroxiredoxin Q/BCP [Kitasatospora viridis]